MYIQQAIDLRATLLVFHLGRQRLKLCAVFNYNFDQPPHVDHNGFLWT